MPYTKQELFDLLVDALDAFEPASPEEEAKKQELQARLLGPEMLDLEEGGL